MTHPFHPFHGRTFEELYRAENWGHELVFFHGPHHRLEAVPLRYTDLHPIDAFVRQARGRVPFRLTDLLDLASFVRDLRQRRDSTPRLMGKE